MERLDDPKVSFPRAQLSCFPRRCAMIREPHFSLAQCPNVELQVSCVGLMAEYRIFYFPTPPNVYPVSCWAKVVGFLACCRAVDMVEYYTLLAMRPVARCAKMAMAADQRYGDHSQDKPLNDAPHICQRRQMSCCPHLCAMVLGPHICLAQCPSGLRTNWELNTVELRVSCFGLMAEYRISYSLGTLNVYPMSCWMQVMLCR